MQDIDQEKQDIQNQLEDLPFETLIQLRQQNLKLLNKKQDEQKDKEKSEQTQTLQKQVKKSKHAPNERSSKQSVKKQIQVFEKKKIQSRDPRFEETSGKLDMNKFMKSYDFLQDMKKRELNEGQKILKSKRKIKKLKEGQKQKLKEYVGNKRGELNQIKQIQRKIQAKKQIKEELRQKGIKNPFVSKRDINQKLKINNKSKQYKIGRLHDAKLQKLIHKKRDN